MPLRLRYVIIIYCLFFFHNQSIAKSLFSHALSLTGLPKYSADFHNFAYVNPKAPKGGLVRQTVIGTFDSFNPYILKGVPAEETNLIYDTLAVSSYDEPFTVYGLVAEQIQYSPDHSWLIFHLNQKARFHDGHPITAQDVIFTFNLLIKQGSPFYRQYYQDVLRVEELNPHQVKFTFKKNANREIFLIIGQLPVLPKHFWQKRTFTKSSLEKPLGSGPYQIKDFKAGQWITYQRVTDYWAKDLPVNRGFYNFNEIRFDYYRDKIVALQAFKAGDADFQQENSAKAWATDYTGTSFETGKIIKQEILHQIPSGMQGFFFNTRRPIFQKLLVRKALNYTFNFEWTNQNIFYNQYQRTQSFFTNSEFASSDLPSKAEQKILAPFREKLPLSVFQEAFHLPINANHLDVRKNLKQALELFKQAGWKFKNGCLRNIAKNNCFTFEILLASSAFERVVLPFKANLTRIGINATVRIIDISQYMNRIQNFDYDMIVGVIGQSLSPGNEQRYFWHSSTANLAGSRNYAGIQHPVIDQLVEKIIYASERKVLINLTRALDRVLLNQWYVIPHWHLNYFRVAYHQKIHRPKITPPYNLAFYTWWIK